MHEELDRLLSEDPEDRDIREAHGFDYDDDFRDLSLLCRNGCGLTYFDVAVDKIETCRGKLKEHEGPCCSSCDWEYEYTDVGMKNFGFGCCCKTEAYNDEIRNTT